MAHIDDDAHEFDVTAQEADARGLRAGVPRLERVTFGDAGPGQTGTAISAVRWGDQPASTVLLHGAALNAHTWDATLLHWGPPVLALDLPGHGESAWRDDADYSPATLAAAVSATLDEAQADGVLSAGPLTLIGHSLGGLTSIALAGLRGADGAGNDADIDHIVLIDALPGLPPEGAAVPDPLAAFMEQFNQLVAGPSDYDSREQIVAQAAALGFGGPALDSVRRGVWHNTRVRPDGRVEWKHHIARLAPEQAVKLVANPQPLWAALSATPARVDLVRAERGIVMDAQVARLLQLKPQARIVETDTGHNVHEEQPEALARILENLA